MPFFSPVPNPLSHLLSRARFHAQGLLKPYWYFEAHLSQHSAASYTVVWELYCLLIIFTNFKILQMEEDVIPIRAC
jgi:hypothetical protein